MAEALFKRFDDANQSDDSPDDTITGAQLKDLLTKLNQKIGGSANIEELVQWADDQPDDTPDGCIGKKAVMSAMEKVTKGANIDYTSINP